MGKRPPGGKKVSASRGIGGGLCPNWKNSHVRKFDLDNKRRNFSSRVGGHQFKVYVRREDVPAVRAVIEARSVRRAHWRTELSEARAFLRRIMSKSVGVKR